jgi:hypothetical protein
MDLFFAPLSGWVAEWGWRRGDLKHLSKGTDVALSGMLRGGKSPSEPSRRHLLAWPNCGDRIN